MQLSSKPYMPRTKAHSANLSGAGILLRVMHSVRIYIAAYRQAKAAEELYLSLARASPLELARRGTTRQGLLQHVRKHLEPAA